MERIVIVYMDRLTNVVTQSIIDDMVRHGQAEEVVAFGGGWSSFHDGSLDEYRKVILSIDMSHPDNKLREFKGYTPHEWECFQFEAVPGVNFKKRCVECGKEYDIKIKE